MSTENPGTDPDEHEKKETSQLSDPGPTPDDPGTGGSDQTKTLLDRSAADVFLD